MGESILTSWPFTSWFSFCQAASEGQPGSEGRTRLNGGDVVTVGDAGIGAKASNQDGTETVQAGKMSAPFSNFLLCMLVSFRRDPINTLPSARNVWLPSVKLR